VGVEVHGRVIDPSRQAVAGASVVFLNVLSGISKSTESSADGDFRVELEPGAYTVTASTSGLVLQARRIEVRIGSAIDLGTLELSLVSTSEQVVVSGSRVSELQEEAPTKVLVADREGIRNTGYERVGDILSEEPGIVTQAQSFGVSIAGGEQIDGMDSKETLVLLDGLPLAGARGIKEGIIDLNQQDVGRLDRVEVVKGAASALYGTDALGGVINLVSREPSNPLEIDATASGGSLGQIDTRLGIGSQWKKLSGFLDVEHHQRNSYTLLPDDPTSVGAYENRQDFLLKLRYAFNPSAAVSLSSSAYANHDHGLGSTFSFDPNDPASLTEIPTALRSNDSTQTYAVTGDFLVTPSTSLQARFYASRYNENSSSRLIDSGVEGPVTDPASLNEDYRRGDMTAGQQWGKRQFLQAGYEFVHDEYRGDNRIVGGNSGQALTTNDLWFQDRIEPFRNLLVTLGGRYQNNSSFGGHFVPKAGAVYRINDHFAVRGAFGQGFRAPNLGELYYHLLHLEFGYQVIGNPTLKPETSESYSAGGTFTMGRYQVSVNLFRNDLHNLIDNFLVCDATSGQDCSGAALEDLLAQYGVPQNFDYDTSGAALFTFINLNVDRAYTRGFDVDGRVALSPTLAFSGAYTYLEAVDSVNHSWLPFRNRHQGHIKLEYAKTRWGLVTNIRGTFFSKWLTESSGPGPADYAYGYQIWNLYASKKLGRGIRAFGAIDNLANSRDQKLSEPQPSFDRPDYGRTFRIGVNYTFPRE
jgi:outer membrane receptor for ferrienterochelin and colicins